MCATIMCLHGSDPSYARAQEFRHILQHGAILRQGFGLDTRLLWKTTTMSIKDNEEEHDWGEVRALAPCSALPNALPASAAWCCVPACTAAFTQLPTAWALHSGYRAGTGDSPEVMV